MDTSHKKLKKWLPTILMELLMLALLSTIILWGVISPLSLGLTRLGAKIAAISCFFSIGLPGYLACRNFYREKVHRAMLWSFLGVFLLILFLFLGGWFAKDIIRPASTGRKIIGTVAGALLFGPLCFIGSYFAILFGIPERESRIEETT